MSEKLTLCGFQHTLCYVSCFRYRITISFNHLPCLQHVEFPLKDHLYNGIGIIWIQIRLQKLLHQGSVFAVTLKSKRLCIAHTKSIVLFRYLVIVLFSVEEVFIVYSSWSYASYVLPVCLFFCVFCGFCLG